MTSTSDSDRIYINEVVTRDGFQSEPIFIPTNDKILLLNRMGQCGYHKIEATSFTSPRAIPALSDAREVMDGIIRAPGTIYTALIPNARGAERALECSVDEMNIVMSISETHNLSNLRMLREQSFAQLSEVVTVAKANDIPVNVSLSTVFGCPMEGSIKESEVLRWAERFVKQEVNGLTLCDTTGMANPAQVSRICRRVLQAFPNMEITLHFHNTRGMALANALAAIEAGVRCFDASLGGLGGCPYAPGATGNVCTEDLVHMFDEMGFDTNIDIDGLLDITNDLKALVDHDLPGQVIKAGRSSTLHAIPEYVAKLRHEREMEQKPV